MSVINTANTFRRAGDFGSNKEKLVKWLEKRENKTVDEIKALRCAKKNHRMWVGIGYFLFLVITIVVWILGMLNNPDSEYWMFVPVALIFLSVLFVLVLMGLLERDFNRFIQKAAAFVDQYVNQYSENKSMFVGTSMHDSEFASSFIKYANTNKNFEDEWKSFVGLSPRVKIKRVFLIFVILFVLFVLPILIYFSFPKYLEWRYPETLSSSNYRTIDFKSSKNKYIATIEYTIDGQVYQADIKVRDHAWMLSGTLHYDQKNPSHVVYVRKW